MVAGGRRSHSGQEDIVAILQDAAAAPGRSHGTARVFVAVLVVAGPHQAWFAGLVQVDLKRPLPALLALQILPQGQPSLTRYLDPLEPLLRLEHLLLLAG